MTDAGVSVESDSENLIPIVREIETLRLCLLSLCGNDNRGSHDSHYAQHESDRDTEVMV
mgnify:FL=1